MAISIAGIIVCGVLLLTGRLLGATLIVPLVASLAFGATAIVSLSSLGGSSPLIFTVFVLALLGATMLRRNLIFELERVFSQDKAPLILAVLLVYACVGSYVYPRIFTGETSAFVASRLFGVTEVPLAPTAGNITQTAYFAFGALTFYAVSIVLLRRENLDKFRTAFLTFAFLHASLGVIDLAGKMAGAGDVLAPIRSASYALLTEVKEAGFFRIVGGFSEASAYAATTLACLGFTFAYGRINGSRLAMILSLVLLALLILSTSTTAYVSLAIVAVPVIVSTARATIAGRLTKADMGLMVIAWMLGLAILAINLYDSHILEPLWKMFDATIFDKATSASAQERGYWNSQSWQSFIDTQGIGVGFGSSRASSWVIAVLSQLGVIGSLAMAALVFELLKGIGRPRQASDVNVVAMHQGARASAFAGLVAASTSSGSADPGLLFFIALAVVVACRRHISVKSSVVSTKPTTYRQPARRKTAWRPDGLIVGSIGAKMVDLAVHPAGVTRADIWDRWPARRHLIAAQEASINNPVTLTPLGGPAKRAVDMAVASLALMLVCPLMLMLIVLVRLSMGGPALFAHRRIGRHGKVFRCYKFRTMVTNADEVLRQYLANNPQAAAEWAAARKLQNDPRVTSVGRLLRNLSLDELPQLINILRGEMSCVGPRPVTADELGRYGPHAPEYLSTRPGLTGLWQVSGRSSLSYEDRIALDSTYVRNWSLWMDIILMVKTIPAVIDAKTTPQPAMNGIPG